MELDYNLYSIFVSIVCVKAFTIGLLLVVLNKPKYKSTSLLGLFLIFLALGTIPQVLNSVSAYTIYPELYLLPLDFFWLYFPLFYLYTQYTCIFSDQKKKYWVLYPGMIAFCLQIAVYFLPYETKLGITQTTGYHLYNLTKLTYGLGIGIYTFQLLNRHKVEVYNYFSFAKSKELTWARTYLTYGILGFLLYTVLLNTAPEKFSSRLFFISFNLILIYWISYHGIQQRSIRSLLTMKKKYEFQKEKSSEKTDTLPTSEKNMEELMNQIHDYLTTSESYTNPELTIVDLSEKLKIHPKRISTAINKVQNQNFNSYINQFRIKKAVLMLKNDEIDNLSIEGIGNEVGFHSKSAFYSAFKKETGTTPSKLKELEAA